MRGAVVHGCEFKWVGDSAIVLLGSTPTERPCSGQDGEHPRGTSIVGNFIREVGVWGKQGCGVFTALSSDTNISHTIGKLLVDITTFESSVPLSSEKTHTILASWLAADLTPD